MTARYVWALMFGLLTGFPSGVGANDDSGIPRSEPTLSQLPPDADQIPPVPLDLDFAGAWIGVGAIPSPRLCARFRANRIEPAEREVVLLCQLVGQ